MVCWITQPFLTERIHLASSLGLVCYFWLYAQVRQRQVHPHWLWLLVPAQALWANLHGGHIQGLALLGIFGVGEGLAWLRARYGGSRVAPALPGRLVLQLLVLPLVAMVAACITPYGWNLLTQPFKERSSVAERYNSFIQAVSV
jgi:hypothetical protein